LGDKETKILLITTIGLPICFFESQTRTNLKYCFANLPIVLGNYTIYMQVVVEQKGIGKIGKKKGVAL
jgi:hypothetical protein